MHQASPPVDETLTKQLCSKQDIVQSYYATCMSIYSAVNQHYLSCRQGPPQKGKAVSIAAAFNVSTLNCISNLACGTSQMHLRLTCLRDIWCFNQNLDIIHTTLKFYSFIRVLSIVSLIQVFSYVYPFFIIIIIIIMSFTANIDNENLMVVK